MLITAYFSSEGTPETGLSPTIRIRDCSDNSLVVTDEAMSEIGDGAYKYEFAVYDEERDYFIRCDSVTLAGNDRYVFAGNENQVIEERTTDIEKLAGYNISRSGDIITIYEADGVSVWRQYNLADQGRVKL